MMMEVGGMGGWGGVKGINGVKGKYTYLQNYSS